MQYLNIMTCPCGGMNVYSCYRARPASFYPALETQLFMSDSLSRNKGTRRGGSTDIEFLAFDGFIWKL